jgi:uncharacterized protein with FMN-binding domain
MKKIVYSILATVAGLVLLFSYRTSLDQTVASPIAIGSKSTPTAGTAGRSTGGSGATPSAAPTASAAPPPSSTQSSGGSSNQSSGGSSNQSSGGSSNQSSGGSSNQSSGGSVTGLKDGTFRGQTADTPYGPLQVSITVSSGVITKVAVPQYPNGSGRDQEINSYALPQLVDETVTAQSAQIDMVSGATYTSQGYLQSLQSALDRAKA